MVEEKNRQLRGSNRTRLASSFIGRNLGPILIGSTFASLGLSFIIDRFFESFLSEHEWICYMFMVPLLLLFIVWTTGMAIEFFIWARENYREHRLRSHSQGAAIIYVFATALVIIAILFFVSMWSTFLN